MPCACSKSRPLQSRIRLLDASFLGTVRKLFWARTSIETRPFLVRFLHDRRIRKADKPLDRSNSFCCQPTHLSCCLGRIAEEVAPGKHTHFSEVAEYSISNILYQESGLWKSTWQCAYGTCLPGFSTFASNCLEAHWNVLDILHGGKEDRETASKCFVQMERDARVWQHDQRLAQIQTRPTFSSPCLLRGDGLMTGKGSLYKKSFRRTTVAKLLRAQHQSPVAIEVDIKSPTCVPAKRIFRLA